MMLNSAVVRGLLMDLSPLRGREFRVLFAGQLVSFFGSMITFVALPFQMYEITHSTLAVGALGLAEFVAIVVIALVSGALADAFDRRTLVRLSELGSAVVMAGLLANALLEDPREWVLFVCATLLAGFYALPRPPLDALVPRVVPREQLKAAMALEWLRGDVGMIAGPALGGVLIAAFGVTLTYGIDLATFLISLGFLALMRATPPPADAERPSLRTIAEGLRYAQGRPVLMGTYLVDVNAMFFGMPQALFPAIPPATAAPRSSASCWRRPPPARCSSRCSAAGPGPQLQRPVPRAGGPSRTSCTARRSCSTASSSPSTVAGRPLPSPAGGPPGATVGDRTPSSSHAPRPTATSALRAPQSSASTASYATSSEPHFASAISRHAAAPIASPPAYGSRSTSMAERRARSETPSCATYGSTREVDRSPIPLAAPTLG
jgi:hypothetical protein